MSRRAHRRKRLAALASNPTAPIMPFVPLTTAMTLPFEEPEVQPHNVNADLNGDNEITNAGLSSIIGIMRTSATPTKSGVSDKRLQQIARMKIRTRLKKGGVVPSGPITLESYPFLASSTLVGAATYAAALSKNLPSSATETASSNENSSVQEPLVEPLPSLYAYDLPRERDSGNVEYKWKLLDKSEDRVLHLTTQLAYRLSEGNGVMLYELGVCDDGYAQGVSPYELECSLQVVSRMARSLQCDMQILNRAFGHEGVVAEVLVRRIGDTQQVVPTQTPAHDSNIASSASSHESASLHSNASSSASSGDLRLAFIGAHDSGRSSLLGCLLSNQLDDGRGRSRLHVFRHRHEIEAGRTSAIARQILGFDAEGRITNYQIHHGKTLGASSSSAASTAATNATVTVTSNSNLKKKEKGLSSFFGDDDDGSGSESDVDFSGDEDVESSVDLGLAPAIASSNSSTALPSTSSLPPSTAMSTANALNVSQACSTNDWQRILEHSHRVFTLFDLPSDFFATITGLIGTSCPDYCCIVVSCQPPSPDSDPSTSLVSALTREQILLCCALGIPFLLLLCKSDLTSSPVDRKRIIDELTQICLQAHVPTAGLQPHQLQPQAVTSSKNLVTVANKVPLLIPSHGTAGDDIHSLLERNMSESLTDSDLPASHRDTIREHVLCARRMHADSHPLQVEDLDSEDILDEDEDDDYEDDHDGVVEEKESKSSVNFQAKSFLYPPHTFTPILFLSSVTGEGIDEFKSYLFHLHNYRHMYWNAKLHDVLPSSPLVESRAQQSGAHVLEPSSHALSLEAQSVEVSIDDIFTVDGVGSVVSGIILSGIVHEGDTLLLGPLNNLDRASQPASSDLVLAPSPLPVDMQPNAVHEICTQLFRPVLVKSLHISRKIFKNAKAGQSVTIALKRVDRALLRKGMVLLSMPSSASVPRPLPSSPSIVNNNWPRCCVGFEAFIQLFDPVSSRDNSPTKQHGRGNSRLFSPTSTNSPTGGASSSISGSSSSKQRGLGLRFQPIVHVGNIRQSAEIVGVRFVQSARARKLVEDWIRKHCRDEASFFIASSTHSQQDLNQLLDEWELNPPSSSPLLGASSTAPSSCALVRFEFLYQSEYLRLGRQILFREDKTRGTGIITKLHYVDPLFEQEEASLSTTCSSSVSPISEHSQVVSDHRLHHSHAPNHVRRPSSGSTPDAATSPSPSPQRSLTSAQKVRRKKSDPKSLLTTANATSTNLASFVFQLAKERSRVSQELAMLQSNGVGPSNSPGPPQLHPSIGISKLPVSKSSNALNQSLRPSSHSAASLPTTPALRPSATPASTNTHVTRAQHGGPQRARADSSGSTQLGPRPSHSTSDSALSSWLHAGEDLNSLERLQLPAAHLSGPHQTPSFLPSSLSTMPLSRIISVDSNGSYDTSSSPSLSSVPTGNSMVPPPRSLLLDDPSLLSDSESDEDNMDGIGNFFGQLEVPKKNKAPISAEELARRKAFSKSKQHQKQKP